MLNVARLTSSVEFYSTDTVGRYFVTSSFACLRGPGIRAVAECMVKSSSEETCESARRLLHCLGQANPRFTLNVYKGLVALFSSDLPIVQRMAATTVRRLQVGLLYVFGYFSVSCLLIQRNFTGIQPFSEIKALFSCCHTGYRENSTRDRKSYSLLPLSF